MEKSPQPRPQAPQQETQAHQEGLSLLGPESEQAIQLQAAANNSSNVNQLRSLQAVANASPQVQQLKAQQSAANQPPIQRKENKTGMPDQLKSGIEGLSGMAMDDVKVHYNSSQPAQMQAHAYAQGSDIHIAPGQEKHLGHEAWHVVQQKQGRVKPTLQLKGMAINDDMALEKEADVMGDQAMRGGQWGAVRHNISKNVRGDANPIQRYLIDAKGGVWNRGHVLGIYSAQLNTAAKLAKLDEYIASPNGYDVIEAVTAITEQRAPAIKVPAVNDIGKLDKGCSVCVIADYLGLTVSGILKVIQASKNPKTMEAVMKIYKVDGGPDELMALLEGFKIPWDIESFESRELMMVGLMSKGAYNGAVAWEGHIIRIKGLGKQYAMWDPQTGEKNSVPPAGKAIKVLYFK